MGQHKVIIEARMMKSQPFEVHSMHEIRNMEFGHTSADDYIQEIADKEAAETIAQINEKANKKLSERLPKLTNDNSLSGQSVESAQVAQYLKRVNRVYKWDEMTGEMVCEMPEEGIIRIIRAEKVKQADLFGGSDP